MTGSQNVLLIFQETYLHIVMFMKTVVMLSAAASVQTAHVPVSLVIKLPRITPPANYEQSMTIAESIVIAVTQL